MITVLRFPKGYQFFDANGFPLALGKLSYFVAGTTTPQDTYSDATGNTPNTNPILLDGSGRLSGDVNLGSNANYKEILTAASGATVAPWPVDNIPKASSAGSSVMVGASAGSAGNAGLAPQPQAGQQGAFLRGDGSWATPLGSGGGPTNIGVTQTSTAVALSSSTGAGAAIPSADTTNAGVMSAADKAKLNGVASGATVQQNSDWNAVSGASQILNKPILGTAASANVPSTGNAASSQVVTGADSRLSDARTPLQHAASHASGGGDALAIIAAQVSGIPASLAAQNLDNVARIGVGVTDANNKLSVSAPSVLFANSGDMRATISKGAEANTAAFNFQENFSTRVQFGLLGDDNFGVQTSPDGATFKSAIVADKTSGAVTFPNTPGFTGDSGSGGAKGLVPAPSSGDAAASKFLKADGTWSVTPTGTGVAQINSDWNASAGVAQILNKPALSTVASSGRYADLTNTPSIPSSLDQLADGSTNRVYTSTEKTKLASLAAQVNADWNAGAGISSILNKPALVASATIDTTNAGNISAGTLPNARLASIPNSAQATMAAGTIKGNNTASASTPSDITIPQARLLLRIDQHASVADANYVALATDTVVAYTAITAPRTVTLPAANSVNTGAALTVIDESGACSATNTITIARAGSDTINGLASAVVASPYGYVEFISDGVSKWTILDTPVFQTNWNATSGGAQILNKPTLAAVATSGNYSDLAGKPTIPSAQVNSDWNASSGVAQILNKPGVMTGDSGSGGVSGLVPAPPSGSAAAGDFLRADGAWALPAGSGSLSGPLSIRDTSQSAIAAQAASKFQIVEGAIQTTDATTLNMMAIPVANGETVMVRAWVSAMLSDSSGGWFQEIYRIFRRPATGNLVTLGTNYVYNMSQKDSNVNTSSSMLTNFLSSGLTDTIYIQVAGETGKTYNWFGSALVHRLKP